MNLQLILRNGQGDVHFLANTMWLKNNNKEHMKNYMQTVSDECGYHF